MQDAARSNRRCQKEGEIVEGQVTEGRHMNSEKMAVCK